VDAVLIIGEHGNYPKSEYEQTKYPRYEFFKQTTDVFRSDGRAVPVFNDKHLSWKWEWAQEMVDISRELKFAFTAGSSLPVTWRMPSVEMPYGAEVEELDWLFRSAVSTAMIFTRWKSFSVWLSGDVAEKPASLRCRRMRGDAVWKAMDAGCWSEGGWDPQLFEACLSRSQTLAQPETFSDRYPTPAQMREWVKDPVAYRFRICRRSQGNHVDDERPGRRFYVCRATER
jgi:hypothetical protein